MSSSDSGRLSLLNIAVLLGGSVLADEQLLRCDDVRAAFGYQLENLDFSGLGFCSGLSNSLRHKADDHLGVHYRCPVGDVQDRVGELIAIKTRSLSR